MGCSLTNPCISLRDLRQVLIHFGMNSLFLFIRPLFKALFSKSFSEKGKTCEGARIWYCLFFNVLDSGLKKWIWRGDAAWFISYQNCAVKCFWRVFRAWDELSSTPVCT